MELRHLRYFVVVGELENIHKAATSLGVTQPALSRQIRDLELELGAPLFERQPRGVRLTLAGRLFLEEAKQILANVQSSKDRFRLASAGKSGALCVAYNGAVAQQPFIPTLLSAFQAECWDVELKAVYMLSQMQIGALDAGEIDAGFGFWSPAAYKDSSLAISGLEHLTVGQDNYVLAVPAEHPLAHREDLRLADLQSEPFIFMSRHISMDLYDRLKGACLAGGLTPQIVHEVDHEIALLSFVAAGMGLCFINASARGQDHTKVVFRTLPDLSVPVHIDLVWKKNNVTPALSRFVQSVSSRSLPSANQSRIHIH